VYVYDVYVIIIFASQLSDPVARVHADEPPGPDMAADDVLASETPDPPLPPQFYWIPIYIPDVKKKKAPPSCFVSDDNTIMDVFMLLAALSDRFTAKLRKKCELDGFDRQMDISAKFAVNRGEKTLPVFHLFFTEDFQKCCLQMPTPRIHTRLVDEYCRIGITHAPHTEPFCLYFIPSDAHGHSKKSRHPYDVLSKAFKKRFNINPEGMDKKLAHWLLPHFAEELSKRAMSIDARKHLGRVLRDLTGGSVKVTYSRVTDTKMEEFGEGKYLFGLTCVFPWAIDILMKRPNCLMTDSTFKALHPYTLPILHAVFANESIPIAFGMAPSETAESYDAIFRHIESLMQHLALTVPPGISPIPAAGNETPSSGPWPEDLMTDLEEQLAGEPVEDEWVEDIPTLEDSVLPPPDADTPGRGAFLSGLPIVTDQGTALALFIRNWQLDWKLCHRHVIEAIGAKSRIGHWAARILRCYSALEWEHTCRVIWAEMRLLKGHYPTSGRAYRSLLRLLGVQIPGDKHPLSRIERWALWLRLGCPRTTNSAESVNGQLNREICRDDDLALRIKSVAKHFVARYTSRNTWCDRALKRNAWKCFPGETLRSCPWFSEKRVEFYQRLHNAVGLSGPVKRRFAAEDTRYMLPGGYDEIIEPCRLPHSWTSAASTTQQEEDPTQIVMTQESCNTWKTHMAWLMTLELRHLMTEDTWSRAAGEIYNHVVEIGTHMGVPDNDPLDPIKEAQWRCECWVSWRKWLGVARPVPPATGAISQQGPAGVGATKRVSPATGAIWPGRGGAAVTKRRGVASHAGSSRFSRACKPSSTRSGRSSQGQSVAGIANTGNTCYINTALQCLLRLNSLREYFDGDTSHILRPNRSKKHNEIATLLCQCHRSLTGGSSDLKNAAGKIRSRLAQIQPRFAGTGQHDLHEWLLLLLDSFHEDLNGCRSHTPAPALETDPEPDEIDPETDKIDPETDEIDPEPSVEVWNAFQSQNESVVVDLFYGQLFSGYRCPLCHASSGVFESYPILSLQIPDPGESIASRSRGESAVTLEECFGWSMAPTRKAHQHQQAKCSTCKRLSNPMKEENFTRLPSVLCIHLIRLANQGPIAQRLSTEVAFPFVLDMARCGCGPDLARLYQLRSFAVHRSMTGSLDSGHYIAYVHIDDHWHLIDDDAVQQVSDDKVFGAESRAGAYVLFYEVVL
jgi:ubiquitin C-terminal hydrolase